MDLFAFTNIIFEKPGEYKDITPGEKRKQFFMVNRRFSVNFPMQANALQHLKINQAGVMDFWQNFMRKQYTKTPGWMFTKGIKKSQEVKEAKTNVSDKLINDYVSKMKVDKKSVLDALEFYPELMKKELQDFEKMINQK